MAPIPSLLFRLSRPPQYSLFAAFSQGRRTRVRKRFAMNKVNIARRSVIAFESALPVAKDEAIQSTQDKYMTHE